MKHGLMMLVTAGLLASGVAAAHDVQRDYFGYYERQQQRDATIAERESRIGFRIHRAGEEGRIRPWEARRLYRELGYVRQKEQAFRADGRMDGREFAELNSDLDRLVGQLRTEAWNTPREYGYRNYYSY